MTMGRPRDERKEQLWRRWIRDWHTSGLTVRAFCEQRGLGQASFYAWRRRLDQHKSAAASFVPVRMVTDEGKPPVGTLDVVLAQGRTVRVAAGFDAATLRQLLAVLEDRPC